ncbi:hypothetical protein [Lactobacillus delbrueckii]|uniref:hypothetical protein n=1 Tax=Lactobacillus delbrueckii TaxID=1584 RepID=UPI0035CFD174
MIFACDFPPACNFAFYFSTFSVFFEFFSYKKEEIKSQGDGLSFDVTPKIGTI